MQDAAARPSTVVDVQVLVDVEIRGVPLCPINVQYNSYLVKMLAATAWLLLHYTEEGDARDKQSVA